MELSNDKSTSGYTLSRAWFDFAFENQDKVTPSHTAMFMWFIELNNRMGWVEKFSSPASQTMAAIGLKSFNTYKKIFTELKDFGFIKVIQESKNQWTACIIALSNFDKALDKALDKAVMKHVTKQSESTIQSTGESIDSINKQLNKETTKQPNQETSKPKEPKQDEPVSDPALEIDQYSFEVVWDLYGKKVGKKEKLEKKWNALKILDKQQAIEVHIPAYKLAEPNKKFRKNFETYLNNESWKDEIISDYGFTETTQSRPATASFAQKQAGVQNLAEQSAEFLRQLGAQDSG